MSVTPTATTAIETRELPGPRVHGDVLLDPGGVPLYWTALYPAP
jgi:hypothetical protein